MRIFLTGAASCLARVLLPKLCSLSYVESIHGIDLKPVNGDLSHPKFTFSIEDLRTCPLEKYMQNCDAVIHLAFIVLRQGISEEDMYQTNVVGSLRVLHAASSANVKRVINLSSVSVYGKGENITEDALLTPSPSLPYGLHKAAVEQEARKNWPSVVHLRPHLIFGKYSQSFMYSMVRSRFYLALPPEIKIQVIHEQDVADAIILVLQTTQSGPFNLAYPEPIHLSEFFKNNHTLMIPLPHNKISTINSMIKKSGCFNDQLNWLSEMGNTLTVNCDRAQHELGWTPKFSAYDAYQEMKLS